MNLDWNATEPFMRQSRKLLELALVLLVIAISVAHFSFDSPSEAGVETPPGRLAVDKVWLGMSAGELVQTRGEPSRKHSQFQEYIQWDYIEAGRLNIVLGPGEKVVTVDGTTLTLNGDEVAAPGTPLTELESILGPCRTPLEELLENHSASFSRDGQLVHVQHRDGKVVRLNMTVDYSVTPPPEPTTKMEEPKPLRPEIVLPKQPVR